MNVKFSTLWSIRNHQVWSFDVVGMQEHPGRNPAHEQVFFLRKILQAQSLLCFFWSSSRLIPARHAAICPNSICQYSYRWRRWQEKPENKSPCKWKHALWIQRLVTCFCYCREKQKTIQSEPQIIPQNTDPVKILPSLQVETQAQWVGHKISFSIWGVWEVVEAPESKLVSDTGESPAQGKLRSETNGDMGCIFMLPKYSKSFTTFCIRFALKKCI